jgi:hypothetical protein
MILAGVETIVNYRVKVFTAEQRESEQKIM